MDIHRSTLRDEVRDLEIEMSVSELLDHITSENTRDDINSVIEDIAKKNIIAWSKDNG